MTKKMRLRSVLLAGSCALLMAMPALADGLRVFTIPAGDLKTALDTFARQAGIEIVYKTADVAGRTTSGINGSFDAHEALTRLLAGTALTVSTDRSGAILIAGKMKAAAASDASASTGTPPASPAAEEPGQPTGDSPAQDKSVEKVTVTGSRIRGAKSSSPVVTITQTEMRRAGHNDLGEVIRAVPQNFSGGQNPGVASGASDGGLANQNLTGGASLNLRGLGPDATLTLLNGVRLPFDGIYQTTDVASIPLAAIDRIEILLDGASAIYGSDAVGGVANIILKRDYDGAELSARVGTATDGGYTQTQYTGVGGTNWISGGFLVAGNISHNTPVRAGQRDYLSYLPLQRATLQPENTQNSALFSGHQEIGSGVEVTLDAFYTERSHNRLYSAFTVVSAASESTIWGLSPTVRFALPDDWELKVHGFVGRNKSTRTQQQYNLTTGAPTSRSLECYCNKAEQIGIEAEGPLLVLPAGEARVSIGAGYRDYELEFLNLITGTPSFGVSGGDRARYAYGELNLPLISEDQGIAFVTRFSLNGALRYEDYESFGETTTPKVGALWTVAPGLDLKASWGKSFKTPTLLQQTQSKDLYLYPGSFFTGAPAGSTIMFVEGGNPDLQPEKAETLAAGFAAQPEFLPGASFEFGWFDIKYTDRVVFPHGARLLQALVNPAVVDFVLLNPSAAQQQAAVSAADQFFNLGNPDFTPAPFPSANVYALVDTRYANAAGDRISGVDLSARYTTDAFGGDLTLSGTGSWILDASRTLTPQSLDQPTAGVVYFPAEFKGRLGASWSDDEFTVSAAASHIGGVTNNQIIPNAKGDSMTTYDLVIDYQTDSRLVGEIGFNLAITNVFDERPPFLQPTRNYFFNYDSTNYSSIGRVVSATVTKRF